MKFMKTLFLALTMIATAHAEMRALHLDEGWTGVSAPEIMGPNYNRFYNSLPMSGQVWNPRLFWSGDYWTLKKGNINYRWNSDNRIGFNLASPSRDQAMRMSQNQLAALSPAEKYDLLIGRYDYPLKTEVATKVANRNAKDWEGMCHGWAPASMSHDEPTPKVLTNPDGISIPFGSSDIKGLLTYYYANGFQVPNTHQMGRRCENRENGNTADCRADLNAGAFHLVLTNRIGIEGKGFIMDLDRMNEVWNHPIQAYKSEVLKVKGPDSDSAPGTVQTIKIRTMIYYPDEIKNYWEPVIGTGRQETEDKDYEYYLDINSAGQIIGGKWMTSDRPDFLWIKEMPVRGQFEGLFYRLNELTNDYY